MKTFALFLAMGLRAYADESATTGSVTAEFLGASGGLKLFPNADTGGFIMVQQGKLEEVAADGSNVPQGTKINMAGQNSWTAMTTTVTDGKTVYSTSFAKTSGSTSFGLTAHLARETTTATEYVPCNNCTNGTAGGCQRASDMACAAVTEAGCASSDFSRCNETVPVTKDQLKFSIVVEDFPFKSVENKLHYSLDIKDKTGDQGTMKEDGLKILLDGGFIETPTTAIIKGGDKDVEVDVAVTASDQGSKRVIDFMFDSFAEGTALYYDPTLGVSTNGGAKNVAGAPLSAAAASLVLAAAVGLVLSAKCV